MSLWAAVIVTALGCYALKFAGMVAPQRLLEDPRVGRFVALVPVALLTALLTVQALADGQSLQADAARLSGLGAAVVALLLRAPFLAVLVAAAATTATLRLLGL